MNEPNAKRHTHKPAADAHSSRARESREHPATCARTNNQSKDAKRESVRALRPGDDLASVLNRLLVMSLAGKSQQNSKQVTIRGNIKMVDKNKMDQKKQKTKKKQPLFA